MQNADKEIVLLLKKAKAGDEESLQRVCVELKHLMHRYFIKKFYDQSIIDDLTQETYLRILNNILSFKEPLSLNRFVLKVAFHVTQDYFRRRYRWEEDRVIKDKINVDEISSEADASLEQEANSEHFLNKLDLERAIERLPEKTQQIFKLKFEGYRYEEIAEMLDTSASGVKMQIKRGVEKLKMLIYHVTFWVFKTTV